MKTDFYIEYNGEKVLEKNLTEKAKEVWKAEQRLVKDLLTLEIYYKPEEKKCYYVFNNKISGFFEV